MQRRVALWGLFGGANLGNEATLVAAVRAIRRRLPQAMISVISPPRLIQPDEDLRDVEWCAMDPLKVSPYLWRLPEGGVKGAVTLCVRVGTELVRRRRAERIVAGFDALVVAGTGVIDDYGQDALGLPLDLWRWCTAAHRHNVPVYFLSIGAGPVRHWIARRLFRRALRLAAYRSYRDASSRGYLGRIGFDVSNDPTVADLAFSLDAHRSDAAWPARSVGVGVMGYRGWNRDAAEGEEIYRRYRDKVVTLVRGLVARGLRVRLLTGDSRADAECAATIIEVAADARVDAPPIASLRNLCEVLQSVDLVIASRFHNLLLALLAGRPAISLSYAEKNDELVECAGFGFATQHIETFDVDRVLADLDRVRNGVRPVRSIDRFVALARDDVERQFDFLVEALRAR